jgi:hypothetical protein
MAVRPETVRRAVYISMDGPDFALWPAIRPAIARPVDRNRIADGRLTTL